MDSDAVRIETQADTGGAGERYYRAIDSRIGNKKIKE
jgi:hypothetical protein